MPKESRKYDRCHVCRAELKQNANFQDKLCDQHDTPANREKFKDQ